MTFTYGSNIAALNIGTQLARVSFQLNKSLERLSTGSRLNHASDGAADMMVSETMTSQIRGFDVATSNVQLGLSYLDTADSAMQQINDHLQNIRDIAVAASNTATTADQFTAYQASLQAEIASIDSISANTKLDGNVLLDGSLSGAAFNIQVGTNSGDTVDMKTAFADNSATTLGVSQSTLASVANATTLLGQADTAIAALNSNLAIVGGFESRMNDQLNYLSIAQTNTSSAQSSIRDTDVASETSNLTRLQIIQQAAAYALAQANIQPQLALKLLP